MSDKPKLKVAFQYLDQLYHDRPSITKHYYFSVPYNLLSQRYEVIPDPDPDVLFFSYVYARRIWPLSSFKCLKIAMDGEAVLREEIFPFSDLVLGNCPDGEESFYFPAMCLDIFHYRLHREPLPEILRLQSLPKQQFCHFIYSNRWPRTRVDFYRKLMKRSPVVSAGSAFRNTDELLNLYPYDPQPKFFERILEGITFRANYRFGIAFESHSKVGYMSEKIIHSFCAGNIPIYWGNPDISSWFNPEAFVNCHDFPNFDAVIDHVMEIEKDPALYKKYRDAPIFTKDSLIYQRDEEYFLRRLEPFLEPGPWQKQGFRSTRPISRLHQSAFRSVYYKECIRRFVSFLRRAVVWIFKRCKTWALG